MIEWNKLYMKTALILLGDFASKEYAKYGTHSGFHHKSSRNRCSQLIIDIMPEGTFEEMVASAGVSGAHKNCGDRAVAQTYALYRGGEVCRFLSKAHIDMLELMRNTKRRLHKIDILEVIDKNIRARFFNRPGVYLGIHPGDSSSIRIGESKNIAKRQRQGGYHFVAALATASHSEAKFFETQLLAACEERFVSSGEAIHRDRSIFYFKKDVDPLEKIKTFVQEDKRLSHLYRKKVIIDSKDGDDSVLPYPDWGERPNGLLVPDHYSQEAIRCE